MMIDDTAGFDFAAVPATSGNLAWFDRPQEFCQSWDL